MLKALAVNSNFPELYTSLKNVIKANWDSNVKDQSKSTQLTAFQACNHQFALNQLPSLSSCVPNVLHEAVVSVFDQLEREFLRTKVEVVSQSDAEDASSQSSEGLGVLRILAGRTAVLMYRHLFRTLESALLRNNKQKSSAIKLLMRHIKHLQTTSLAVIAGAFPETAGETERRQYVGGGLTHVTDDFFNFFMHLDNEIKKVNTTERATEVGPAILNENYKHLLHDEVLNGLFSSLFTSFKDSTPSVHKSLYDMLLTKYLPVSNNTFRKTILKEMGVEKEQALRVDIRSKSRKRKGALKVIKMLSR